MNDTYSIRQVIDLTGISEFTLRGWENRYNAFKPRRTSTGRRSYSQADLQKALLLRELLRKDHRIGNIAELHNKDLERLLEKNAEEMAMPAGEFQHEIEKLLRNLSLQNWDKIETHLERVALSADPQIVLNEFFVPLIKEFSLQVASGIITVAQEHIFSSFLRKHLHLLSAKAPKCKSRFRFLVATPEGDFHELGILVAHLMLAFSGIRALYIGVNTPKKELCEAALRYGATHIVLGSTVSRKEGAKEDLFSYLHFLDQNLNEDMEIWLGGRNATTFPNVARKMLSFTSLIDFENALQFVGKKGT